MGSGFFKFLQTTKQLIEGKVDEKREWKPYQKSVRLQGFLQLCLQTLKCPPSGTESTWVFFSFSQETQGSLVFKPVIPPSFNSPSFSRNVFLFIIWQSDWLHHHSSLRLFLGLCFCLSSGKATAPECATSMAFTWMFERSSNCNYWSSPCAEWVVAFFPSSRSSRESPRAHLHVVGMLRFMSLT